MASGGRGSSIAGRPMLAPPPAPGWSPHQCFDAVFTPAQCARIVELGAQLLPEEAALEQVDAPPVDEAARRARVAWIGPDDETDWLYRRLAAVTAKANRTWGFELSGFLEDLQFTRYDEPGDFYTWHQDGLDGEVATRKLSLVVQLSDPATYRGSTLEFLDVVEDYDETERRQWADESRAQGTVVAFPAFEYHRVTPLEAGTRLSLVCWVSGPRFR